MLDCDPNTFFRIELIPMKTVIGAIIMIKSMICALSRFQELAFGYTTSVTVQQEGGWNPGLQYEIIALNQDTEFFE